MPLTPLQIRVLAILRDQRHLGSHIAGSLPLHVSPDSSRESRDIDVFHDAAAAMLAAYREDEAALAAAGFAVRHSDACSATFHRAIIHDNTESVEIDWAIDSAWRFFPPLPDELLGWRLHDLDLACNKALALASRSETRDLVDLIDWARRFDLASIVWAACGKDPGYNPLSLLEQMRRSARIDPGQLAMLKAKAIDPIKLKQSWLALAETAESEMTALADRQPDTETGVIFVDGNGACRWPHSERTIAEQGLVIHRPSVGGCVPMMRLV